jgi:hypothetical protein
MKKHKDGSHIRKDIPPTGWTTMDCIDNRTADHRCQACGYPKVRFVHKLTHPALAGQTLLAGFICASQLTGHTQTLHARELQLRRRSRMRDQFMERGWSTYRQDNGLGLALRRESSATFMIKEQLDRSWTLCRTGREIGTTVITEGHPSREAAVLALFGLLHEGTI